MNIKKTFIYSGLSFLVFLLFFNVASAVSGSFLDLVMGMMAKDFAGQITNTKAKDIDKWEKQGYTCTVSGSTFEIKPQNQKMPSSYMVPSGVKSKTNNTISNNQNIMGKYSGKTTITCKKPCPPPPGYQCMQVVILDKVSMYGNSKK